MEDCKIEKKKKLIRNFTWKCKDGEVTGDSQNFALRRNQALFQRQWTLVHR